MQLTRQQRINNIGTTMVNELLQLAFTCRQILQNGYTIPERDGCQALEATGEEICHGLGDNAESVKAILSLILDPIDRPFSDIKTEHT